MISLTLLSLVTYSQDSLENKVRVIEHEGEVLIAMDTITAKEIAHGLQEGETAKLELNLCDSARVYADSALISQQKINKNQSEQLKLKDNIILEKDNKIDIWKQKFDASEEEKKRYRKKMWLWAGAGTAGGVVAGIIVGVLLNNK